MDSENKYWLGFFSIVGIVIISVLFISLSYWKDHNAKIVELIGEGVDPVAAMCAMQNSYGRMPVCIVLAVKGED